MIILYYYLLRHASTSCIKQYCHVLLIHSHHTASDLAHFEKVMFQFNSISFGNDHLVKLTESSYISKMLMQLSSMGLPVKLWLEKKSSSLALLQQLNQMS